MPSLNTGNSILSNAIKVDSSYNVGIGGSPNEKLTIIGSSGLAGMARWTDATNSCFLGLTSGGVGYIHSNSNTLAFGANGSNNFAATMTLTSGNVGIGTSSPSQLLDVAGVIRISGSPSNPNDATAGYFWNQSFVGPTISGGSIAFNTGSTGAQSERMRILANGRIGVNTTSPAALFEVRGTGNAAVNSHGNLLVSSGGTASQAAGSGGQLSFGAWLNGDLSVPYPVAAIRGVSESSTTDTNRGALIFATMNETTNTERIRITSAGVLDFNGTGDVASINDKLAMGYRNGNYGWIQSFGGTALYLNKVGNAVYAGSQRIDNNSDQRLKENIESVENALDIVLNLKGRKFNMIDENGKLRYGFVAQEVQPHLSDFVTESDRSYEKDDVKIENLFTLESSGASWAALLVEAIKEQQKQIDELKQLVK